ncbi:MAG: cytochrome c maturation protein CcmE [Proteobacteria bacterium]|nr:cytochrome c maturation protein CcmE [Pseudomonadota bacterium]
MTLHQRRKLYFIILMIFSITIATGLILFALRQNINLFYTPTQLVSGEAPQGRMIRIGGLVEKNSVVRSKTDLTVIFRLTDLDKAVEVRYQGILPDLFREGQGIVVQGKLNNQHQFIAEQVLAKHDANYMPSEVKAALKDRYKKDGYGS